MIEVKEPSMTTASVSTDINDAIAPLRSRLLEFGADRSEPAWSSKLLDDLFDEASTRADGAAAILWTLFEILGGNRGELTPTLGCFIKDIVVGSFVRNRSIYINPIWGRIESSLGADSSKAQLYLALLGIPPDVLSATTRERIVVGLQSTLFGDESRSILND